MLDSSASALPASLRRTNLRKAVSLLLRSGELSRADLAKAAGMSQPTAGKIFSELLGRRILMETTERSLAGPKGQARLGRPGRMLCLEQRHPRFLGVELGIKATRISGLTFGASEAWAEQFPTPTNPDAWLKQLARAVHKTKVARLHGVVVSVPGIVDEARGRVLYSPNLHWLERADLAAELERRFDKSVVLIQEIRALALGHALRNAEQDFFLVDFGAGVGGAVFMEGRLHGRGAPLSGELGHTPVPGNTRLCGCGGQGCLETLVSESGLLESFASAHPGRKTAGWKGFIDHLHHSGVPAWLEESLVAAGRVIAGALNVLGLQKVIVTGSLTEMPSSALEALRATVMNAALWRRFGEVLCEAAPRRRHHGMVAAGLDHILFPNNESGSGKAPSAALTRLTGQQNIIPV